LLTNYSYDSNTGELLKIDYLDTTPDVIFQYDRLGRQTAISDGAGNHQHQTNNNIRLFS
jgi:hypothetical protein